MYSKFIKSAYPRFRIVAAIAILYWFPLSLTAQQVPVELWERQYKQTNTNYFGGWVKSTIPTSDGGCIISGTERLASNSYDDEDYYFAIKVDSRGNEEWKRNIGGNKDEHLLNVTQTSDGGYLLAGSSESKNTMTKTAKSEGGEDYWVVKLNAQGHTLWDKAYGGTKDDRLTNCIPTSDGGVILGGRSNSNISGSRSCALKNAMDYWVIKIDSEGKKVWDTAIDSYHNVRSHPNLIRASDGGIIFGGICNNDSTNQSYESEDIDYLVVKLNSQGKQTWIAKAGGNKNDELYSISPTSDGGCIANGRSSSDVSWDKTDAKKDKYDDIWVVKFNGEGRLIWNKIIGSRFYNELKYLEQSPDGGYLVAVYTYNIKDGPSYNRTVGCGGTERATSTKYINKGTWLFKFDSNGAEVWKERVGSKDGSLSKVKQAKDGSITLIGTVKDKLKGYPKSEDYWMSQFRPNGTKVWSTQITRTINSDEYHETIADTEFVADTPDSGMIIGGTISNGYNYRSDFWLIKLGQIESISQR